MRLVRLLLPLVLFCAPSLASAQDTRPLAVGEGHGFDPGAKRRAPSPIDDEEAPPAPPRAAIVPTVIEHGRRDRPLVALTFDACPSTVEHGGFRRDIVEFLRREQIPATLLVSSKWAKWRPEVVEELATDPLFEVETHGGVHVDMRRYEPAKMRHELERSIAVIHQLTGRTPQYFRPPRGAWDDTLVHEAAALGLAILQFDVVSADAEASFRPERIVENVLSSARPGSIVVLHMNGPAKHTLDALPAIIAGLRARGLGFARVSDLVGEEEASVEPLAGPAPAVPIAAAHEEDARVSVAAVDPVAAVEPVAAVASVPAVDVAVAPAPTLVSIAPAAATQLEHVLRPGERVTDLATWYGSTSADILRANAITDPRKLQPGRRLVIPLTRRRR